MSALSSATSTRPVRGPGTAGTTSPASSGSQRSASLTKGVTAPDTAGASGAGGASRAPAPPAALGPRAQPRAEEGGARARHRGRVGRRRGELVGGQVRGAQGQRDGEGGADVGRAVDRDVAAVQADELAHHRQADAAALAGARAGAGDAGEPLQQARQPGGGAAGARAGG